MEELKHVIALLLEDAKRLQQIKPNAGTEARITQAIKVLEPAFNAKIECSTRKASLEAPKKAEETIIFDGVLVNEQFATHVVDKFHPTISRVIEEMVLNGKPEDQIKEAAATTGRAIVAGVRELIRSASTRLKGEPSPHAQVQKD